MNFSLAGSKVIRWNYCTTCMNIRRGREPGNEARKRYGRSSRGLRMECRRGAYKPETSLHDGDGVNSALSSQILTEDQVYSGQK